MAFRKCLIKDCSKPQNSHGYCGAHGRRWRLYGDPLGSKPRSLGKAQRFLRDVVLTDERGAEDPCLIWPFARTGAGYAQVKKSYVARIACEEANGPPPTPKHDAAHNCGKGHLGCVTKSHLRWATRIENMADTLIHGTRSRGEHRPTAKLTEADVLEIRDLCGHSFQRDIAERFGVSVPTVSAIQARKSWTWL